ncbi:D-alanine--D-alanine ligase [Candidatus Falkowbacteria bacterium]|nr:D-alanine--D-alanine ligase [Candidatus Falkowbacteria bacterium]
MSKKIKVGVIFGGRSGEHEVSLVSAESVMKALDRKKYDIVQIGITKRGEWVIENAKLKIKNEKLLELFKQGKIKNGSRLPPEILTKVDVVFPVLHGTYGEDGTIQGLFEMMNIPYVGAGVLGSAVGMDKIVQKQLCEQAGLPVVKYIWFNAGDILRRPSGVDKISPHKTTRERRSLIHILRHIEKTLKYPCFIKPANMGSSVGISKSKNRRELIVGINLAAKYDKKILVEEAVSSVREIECSVLGNDDPIASMLGEVISSGEFYDYDAKYVDGRSRTVIPAEISKTMTGVIRDLACQVFCVTNCLGMARVDFLLDNKRQKIYVNEINTIPGFTSISMYPKLWQASGLSYSDLLDNLINLAIRQFEEKQKLQMGYKPKKKWYR